MPDYLLRNIDPQLWRRVKSAAALEGVTVRELILNALQERINQEGKTMTAYAIIDNHSGLLFWTGRAEDALTACKTLDKEIGEHGREYHEDDFLLADDGSYIVYELSDEELEQYKDADGANIEVADEIAESHDPVAVFRVERPSDWG